MILWHYHTNKGNKNSGKNNNNNDTTGMLHTYDHGSNTMEEEDDNSFDNSTFNNNNENNKTGITNIDIEPFKAGVGMINGNEEDWLSDGNSCNEDGIYNN